jgi:predicted tellurium resistance membrane protein TerC
MSWLAEPEAWIALLTLTALEIVLGIDNIIFISILVDKLPEAQRRRARIIGLSLAMGMRILLLLSLSGVMRLEGTLFSVLGNAFSGRDLILIGGGLFLLTNATREIHEKLAGEAHDEDQPAAVASFGSVLVQIALLDVVFSLDSVITAIGMAERIEVMIIAVVVAVGVMMVFAGAISRFISARPTLQVLALSFLILIGVALIGDGLEMHIPKGYIYFAIAFSGIVEAVNLKLAERARGIRRRARG